MAAMARILHLSDIHIAGTSQSDAILDVLPHAVRTAVADGPPIACIFVTGDVFDSSTMDRTDAMARFLRLHEALAKVLPAVPSVVLPGNHDRRGSGLFGPHDPGLFDALRDAAKATRAPVFVAGCDEPRRAQLVPPDSHGLPVLVATYDSTVLLKGKISAGGDLRQDDFLYLASVAGTKHTSRTDVPLLLLVHHHLIPTPLTDVGRVNTKGRPFWQRWLVHDVGPWALANADREELTMTALGAGSALSTLHAFGRPVVVLHGHKHYPTARLLVGTRAGDNDVALVSAGSAGTEEPWAPSGNSETGRLWPSFNLVDVGEGELTATTVAFSTKRQGEIAAPRLLASLRCDGVRWTLEREAHPIAGRARLASNDAAFELEPSNQWGRARWDLSCSRTLKALGAAVEYPEVVEAAPGSTAELIDDGARRESVPFRLSVSTAKTARYRIAGGVCRTTTEASAAYRQATAFEWVGLVNRIPSTQAALRVTGLPETTHAFGSITDMTTGQERPLVAERLPKGQVELRCDPCPEARLLRVYWMLE
jgi:3',5'-cyclic AMP phosphodiesterase CpdA